MRGDSQLGQHPDEPLGRVPLPRFYAVAVIVLELVVIVVVTLAEGEEREKERVARSATRRVRLPAQAVAGAVNEEGCVLGRHDPGDPADQEATQRADPAVVKKSGKGRQDKTDKDGEEKNVAMLPAHERVTLEIGDIIQGRLGIQFEQHPTHVGMEKTLGDVVRIVVVVGVFVVPAMIARPHEDGIFEGGRSENEHHQAQRPFRFIGFVGEKTVITSRDAESRQDEHDEEHPHVKPVEAKEPEIDRQRGHGQQGRSDEERTGDPIDPLKWKRKNFHGTPMFA